MYEIVGQLIFMIDCWLFKVQQRLFDSYSGQELLQHVQYHSVGTEIYNCRQLWSQFWNIGKYLYTTNQQISKNDGNGKESGVNFFDNG